MKRNKPNCSSFAYKLARQYPLYLFRWQLSTPLLAIVSGLVTYGALQWQVIFDLNFWQSAAISNLVGGLIFFWFDRYIFRQQRGYRVSLTYSCPGEFVSDDIIHIKNARCVEFENTLYVPLSAHVRNVCAVIVVNIYFGKEHRGEVKFNNIEDCDDVLRIIIED